MADKVVDLGSGFWNVRGSLCVEGEDGMRDAGAQCSLVQLQSGRFIFLDSYKLTNDVREQVMTLTNNGQDVEAVLNVHPYHTIHCAQMAKDFPQAIFYGSRRHPEQVPEVQWADDLVESDAVSQRYPELEFSLPQGIYYIAPEEEVHAGSLLVFHPASKSLHVDDTFMTPPEKPSTEVLPEIVIHPSTKKALKDEPDAGQLYCNWVSQIAIQWSETRNFCAAHSHLIEFEAGGFQKSLLTALNKVRPDLEDL